MTEPPAAVPDHRIAPATLAALPSLCRQFHVRELALFGSAVSDRVSPASDLDLLVAFEDLPSGAYADAYFGPLDALQSLFGRPVDPVTEPALQNPHFRRQIEAAKIRLFPSP
jgi:uncharacterized protein